MVELEDPDGRDHPNVGAAVPESRCQRGDKVLHEICNPKGGEAAEGEATNHGIVVPAILLEEIDGEEGKIGVGSGVVADVEVAHLLEDDVGCSGAHHHLAECRGYVDPDGHEGDNLLEEFPPGIVGAGRDASGELTELELQIRDLAFP